MAVLVIVHVKLLPKTPLKNWTPLWTEVPVVVPFNIQMPLVNAHSPRPASESVVVPKLSGSCTVPVPFVVVIVVVAVVEPVRLKLNEPLPPMVFLMSVSMPGLSWLVMVQVEVEPEETITLPLALQSPEKTAV